MFEMAMGILLAVVLIHIGAHAVLFVEVFCEEMFKAIHETNPKPPRQPNQVQRP